VVGAPRYRSIFVYRAGQIYKTPGQGSASAWKDRYLRQKNANAPDRLDASSGVVRLLRYYLGRSASLQNSQKNNLTQPANPAKIAISLRFAQIALGAVFAQNVHDTVLSKEAHHAEVAEEAHQSHPQFSEDPQTRFFSSKRRASRRSISAVHDVAA
jgi:hypothetical protein